MYEIDENNTYIGNEAMEHEDSSRFEESAEYDSFIKDLYPEARKMKCEFVLHVGPTNSGKTYKAIEALKESENGVYLAPLKMLAMEVAEKINKSNIPCNTITGEGVKSVSGAKHISQTIETLDLTKRYDVAVIDEAQFLGDCSRGTAWTDAILGVQAKEIHVCTAPEAEDIVKDMIRYCGDTIKEVDRTMRSTKLNAEKMRCNIYCFGESENPECSALQPGDAVVAFSKGRVLELHDYINNTLGIPCSAIYGKMPNELKLSEAEKFASGQSQVIVATDAIGIGMNLPIKRIVLSDIEKFDGCFTRPLQPDEVKQILGRAGRQGMYDEGRYTVSAEIPGWDYNYIKDTLHKKTEDISEIFVHMPKSYMQKKLRESPEKTMEDIQDEFVNMIDTKDNVPFTAYPSQDTCDILYTLKSYEYLTDEDCKNVDTNMLLKISRIQCDYEFEDSWNKMAAAVIKNNGKISYADVSDEFYSISQWHGDEEMCHAYDMAMRFMKSFGSNGDIEMLRNDKQQYVENMLFDFSASRYYQMIGEYLALDIAIKSEKNDEKRAGMEEECKGHNAELLSMQDKSSRIMQLARESSDSLYEWIHDVMEGNGLEINFEVFSGAFKDLCDDMSVDWSEYMEAENCISEEVAERVEGFDKDEWSRDDDDDDWR